jgi:hypothetical protein
MTTDDAIARCVYTVLTECDVKAQSTRLLVMQMLSNTSRTATDIAPYLPSTKMAGILMDMQEEWIARREWMRHQPDPPVQAPLMPSRGPHVLTDKDGSQALCGGPGLCEACERGALERIIQRVCDAREKAELL